MAHHEVIVIGAGIAGLYQLKRLIDLDTDVIALEAEDDLGGTWFRNRYPGCRFDSEAYTYGYSWSKELLDEWHWSEHFSSQPENLRYLNFVADKFDLRTRLRFGCRVESMIWQDDVQAWHISLTNGETHSARFVIGCLGVVSAPTLPSYEGMDDFEGESFHTFHWPAEPLELAGRRVGVIGTGATGIQVIAEIADKVGELKVFQRRPNWSCPLNNAAISTDEMADIRSRYDEIFEQVSRSPGGFVHQPRWGFWEMPAEERRALWDELYEQRGFSILAGNFAEISMDEAANREMSDYIAERIRARVDDPDVAEKLIPKDHGFGTQRLPLETHYFEAYNRENVELIDLSETPIEKLTADGIQTTAAHFDLDVIVYATGFDAFTGAYDRIEIRGVDGERLGEKWRDGPSTYLGVMTSGYPNLFMVAGPQGVSGSSNYPPAIQRGVDWITRLVSRAMETQAARVEADAQAESEWVDEVIEAHERLLSRRSKGWITGYNSNVNGHEEGVVRYVAYWGGAPRYAAKIAEVEEADYRGISIER